MLVNLLIIIYLMAFKFFIFVYKTFVVTTFKILAFAIDYFVIVFYSVYYFHSGITTKFATGKEVYFVNALVGLAIIFLYTLLIRILHSYFPTISTLANFVLAFIGVSLAVPITINLISPIIEMLKPDFTFNGDIIISQNHVRNLVYKNILFALIALPVWQHRMEKLTEEP